MGADRRRLRRLVQRRGVCVDLLPERQPLHPRDRRVHGSRREGRRVADQGSADRPPLQDLQGARAHGADRRLRVGLRRSGHAVRHHDQPLEPGQGDAPHQRVESVQRVHVRGRLGLQPGVSEPDEVLQPRGRLLRRADVQARLRRRGHGAGDAGRQLLLPDAGDRRELAQVPSAGPGLREPRRAPDGDGSSVRLRRGSRLRRGDHVA